MSEDPSKTALLLGMNVVEAEWLCENCLKGLDKDLCLDKEWCGDDLDFMKIYYRSSVDNLIWVMSVNPYYKRDFTLSASPAAARHSILIDSEWDYVNYVPKGKVYFNPETVYREAPHALLPFDLTLPFYSKKFKSSKFDYDAGCFTPLDYPMRLAFIIEEQK